VEGRQGDDKILLAHGGGGVLMRELISRVRERLGSDSHSLQDSAFLKLDSDRIAFTTDSFVIKPVFFPGGDIGHLSVCGTVNDLAVSGADPLCISLSYIIEEGFSVTDLDRITDSVKAASAQAGVDVVTGDTKVVQRGMADGIFINTAGIGVIPAGVNLSSADAREGDAVIVNGTVGDHGLAILSLREGIDFGSGLESDTAPLNLLISGLIRDFSGIRCMRDATRGGIAAVLNEIAVDSGVGIRIEEKLIPVREAVRSGCELMGYEPLHIANEGKFVLIADSEEAEAVVNSMRRNPLGLESEIIGKVSESPAGKVVMRTGIGGERVVDFPYGDILPRIC